MKHLLEEISSHHDFKEVKTHFKRGDQDLLTGISGSQKSLVIACLFQELNGACLVISYHNNQAQRLALDLQSLIGAEEVTFFPANELFPHEEAYEPEVTAQRIDTLTKVLRQDRVLVVTSWEALQRRLLPAEQFLSFVIKLELEEDYSLSDLLTRLVTMGYQRVDQVQTLGEFSLRGSILDIFPLDAEDPIRVDFFGETVDSIRRFSVEDQLSKGELEQVTITPAREGLWQPRQFQSRLEDIKKDLADQVNKLEDLGRLEAAEALKNRIDEAVERLSAGQQLPGADQFLPWVEPQLVTLLDYLPQARVILDEPIRGGDAFAALELETAGIFSNFLEKGVVLPREQAIFAGLRELQAEIFPRKPWSLSLLAKTPKELMPEHTLNLPFRIPPNFHSKVEHLGNELERWQKESQTIVLALASTDKARRLREVLRERGITTIFTENDTRETSFKPGVIQITVADLESGLIWLPGRIFILTEVEIYGRQKRRAQIRSEYGGAKIASFTDLKPGDYVVHLNHGIGQYVGIETLEIAGGHRDYLRIQYAGADRLFIPTDQVNLLQKYVGVEDSPPKVNKLGGGDWQKVKNRVKESIRDMAEQLLELYAQREVAPGFAFSQDTVWQHEFEESFIFEETPDQLKAVAEIKEDMERAKPMDRLLCGDVGYGKTEVAMRAAFKAIMEGKQVGVLVPTTILAQQHFLTFRERYAGYPINIRVLSRFQTPKEHAATVETLLTGEVDLVIGTHRLLSPDVHFKELGLLIIDEEQRFGVTHKEKLKELRKNVDVLTLSATPIPRTLHMALAGIRDMSIIETPPQGRFPIRTHVLEFNEEVIREAIQRELDRKGQIYFVYNRVETIERMATYLQNLLPEARISIAHGQMDEDQLEAVMLDFNDYQADILLCTTIIETGLDIPNVNTLVVYDADRFGLAQLYQLRGRVGRSNRIAHAYFCYRRDKTLAENAEKRLAAIREFTELGSGFKIAMRDLEIRGAGNLLGPEQHGQIAAVGFELYCRLLEETIREKRGEVMPEFPEPVVEIPADAYIPKEYISDSRQKVEIYKKIAASGPEGLESLTVELQDRFGTLPQAVTNLLSITKIKALAKELGIAAVNKERNELIAKLHAGLGVDYEKVLLVLQKYRSHFRYLPGRPPVFRWKANLPDTELLKMVLDSLNILRQKVD